MSTGNLQTTVNSNSRFSAVKKSGTIRKIWQDKVLYLLIFPVILYFAVFHLWPIWGMKMAFQDFRIVGKSVFVGFKHFKMLFSSPAFFEVLQNTVIISSMKLFLIFPLPILFAILLNEIQQGLFRKYVQVVSYLPHFLSWVVIAGIWINMLSPSNGAVNIILGWFGQPPVDFITSKEHIRWVLLFSEAWRSMGWDSIIYLAALMKISYELYESARIDGASRIQQIVYITLPELVTTMITVFILNLGFFMSAGLDQVFNFANDSVISAVDILDTYVYRLGLQSGQYSLATAASMFKGLVGFLLIYSTHLTGRKISGKGLW